jgi:hypothetical protein
MKFLSYLSINAFATDPQLAAIASVMRITLTLRFGSRHKAPMIATRRVIAVRKTSRAMSNPMKPPEPVNKCSRFSVTEDRHLRTKISLNRGCRHGLFCGLLRVNTVHSSRRITGSRTCWPAVESVSGESAGCGGVTNFRFGRRASVSLQQSTHEPQYPHEFEAGGLPRPKPQQVC